MALRGWLLAAAFLAGQTGCKHDDRGQPIRDGGTAPGSRADAGAVQVTAYVNACPLVTLTVTPPDAKVGEQIDVRADVTDPDAVDRITYDWSAGAGSFGDPTVAQTRFTCSAAAVGPQTIVLTVSDGSCSVVRRARTFCYATGVQAGTGGGGGAAGAAASGGASGGGSGGSVGSGGSTGGTGGRAGAGDAGGGAGGIAGAGGTGVDTGGATGRTCTGDPARDEDEGSACAACTHDNCVPATDGCDNLPSDLKTASCARLYCCIRANHCTTMGDPTNCWCGTAPLDRCLVDSHAANGPCVREFQDAAESSDPPTIKQRFVDPDFGLGHAVNLALCRGNYCGTAADPLKPACGIP